MSDKCIYKCIRCGHNQVDVDHLDLWICNRCGQSYKMRTLTEHDDDWTQGIPIGAEDWLVAE